MTTENNNNSQKLNVSLSSLKGKKGLDLKQFHNQEITIDSVEVKHSLVTRDGKTEDNYYLEVTSSPLNENGFTARTFISLWKNEETGEFNYSLKENSNSYKMLNFFQVSSFEELVGKKTTAILRLNDNGTQKVDIYYGQ